MSTVEMISSGGPAGAEIRGVDLAQRMDDATFREIEGALHRHVVVYFRDQRLTPAQHIAFSRRFGPLEIHVLKQYLLPSHPEILVLSNIKDDRGELIGLPDGGRTWHTDTSYRASLSRASVLYAIEIPQDDTGQPLGDTLWASTAAAYDALPEPMRRRLDGLKAIYQYGKRARVANSPLAKLTDEQRGHARGTPSRRAHASLHRP
jgi:taurine dioxygenase